MAQDPVTSGIQSTPNSKGTSTNLNSDANTSQQQYQPYLIEDLRSSWSTCSVDDWATTIFGYGPHWRSDASFREVADHEDYARFRQAFSDRLSKGINETELYGPTVQWTNHILSALAAKVDPKEDPMRLRITRNDPVHVRGRPSWRKPDLVAVEQDTVVLGLRKDVASMMKGGPSGFAFWWPELLGFWEMWKDSREFSVSPSKTYTVFIIRN
jgi:hypothetical protein